MGPTYLAEWVPRPVSPYVVRGASWRHHQPGETTALRDQLVLEIRPGSCPSATAAIYGDPTDTWGRTWSGAQLSNANLRIQEIDVSNKTGRDFTLEYVAVNVYYAR